MSALDDIARKRLDSVGPIEKCLILGIPTIRLKTLESAAAELAALRRVADMAELALVVMRRDHPNCFEENREWCEYVQLKQALDELRKCAP